MIEADFINLMLHLWDFSLLIDKATRWLIDKTT